MTDQEIIESAKRHADGWRVTLDMDRERLCNEQQMAYDLLAAAERIRVLGLMAAEGELYREYDDTADKGGFSVEVWNDFVTRKRAARAATDAARRGA